MMICKFLSFGHLFQDYTFDMQSDIPALSIVSGSKWRFSTFLTIYNWLFFGYSINQSIMHHFENFKYINYLVLYN